MIEAKLQKKLRTAILQVSCIFVVFLICGGMLFFHLRDIQNTAVRDQLLAEAEEYKSRIYKQFESDFQVLYTLSAFIEEPRETEDWVQITQDLNAAIEGNNFLSMAFYDRDMRGVICMLGEEPLTNMAPITRLELPAAAPSPSPVLTQNRYQPLRPIGSSRKG